MKNNFASARSIGHGGGYVGVNGVGRDRDFVVVVLNTKVEQVTTQKNTMVH
ncbi:TPA: hypothetical protein KQH07_002302 [Clostridioides difficile]|nr:hypothetical protein [Clostridioides difficile]